MPKKEQAKFSQRVKVALIITDTQIKTVTALARKLGKSREAVSRAIHTVDFPAVRRAIAKELSIDE